MLLLLDAVAGDADGALAYADLVPTTAGRSGSRSMAMSAHAGLGLLQLGLDHPEAAIVHLTRTREIAEHAGFAEPNYVQWMGDLVESQIRAGLEDEARSTLAEFEGQATRTGRPGPSAPPRAAAGCWRRRTTPTPYSPRPRTCTSPFERARTELCWGERLRRDGRRIDARRHLHEAHRAFAASARRRGPRRRRASCAPAAAAPGAGRAPAAAS